MLLLNNRRPKRMMPLPNNKKRKRRKNLKIWIWVDYLIDNLILLILIKRFNVFSLDYLLLYFYNYLLVLNFQSYVDYVYLLFTLVIYFFLVNFIYPFNVGIDSSAKSYYIRMFKYDWNPCRIFTNLNIYVSCLPLVIIFTMNFLIL